MRDWDFDGVCPYGLTKETIPKFKPKEHKGTDEKPCPTKVCRMGNKECKQYRSCRDTCVIVNKRITEMDECPEND